MSHAVTWRCAKCQRPHFTTAGSRFVQFGAHKRRLCAECVAALAILPRKEHRRASHNHP